MAKQQEAPSSSRIPKHIRKIIFGRKTTTVAYDESFKPAGMEDIIEEHNPKQSTQPRHDAFNRAMERFAVHGILRTEFAEVLDRHGKPLDADWWDSHLYEDDERFNTVKVTGVIITSKKTTDMFQILLEKTTVDKKVVKWKSPSISLLKVEGWNYPLLDEAKLHLETLLMEADEFRKGKSALGQLRMSLVA